MKNVKELQDELAAIYESLKSETMTVEKANALSNIAGKIIAASAVQVKYYAMQKTKPRIGFLSTRGNSDEMV